ncbi:MAG: phosphatidate cytidylyltransferase [Candidatus Cryptobacteroides sp.]|nr:phosphatidate cytidylyltransferase [Bacteroidales bacterium]
MNNTVKRTISGVAFVCIMLAGLTVSKFLFAALIMFIMGVMMHEFYTITMKDRYKFSRILAILSGETLFVLLFLTMAYDVQAKYVAIAILPTIIVMVNSLYVKDKTEFGKFSDIYTAILYIAVPLSLSNLIVFFNNEFNGHLLLYFFILIWASDIGGFVFGCSLGKYFPKKLFPEISPKKTWVGFWGGMFCSVLAAVIIKFTMCIDISLFHAIVLAVIMDIAGVYGDLFESQWKRYYLVKDSGVIIPGHGGLLDRFDSTLFSIPIGALYLILMNIF